MADCHNNYGLILLVAMKVTKTVPHRYCYTSTVSGPRKGKERVTCVIHVLCNLYPNINCGIVNKECSWRPARGHLAFLTSQYIADSAS